MKKIAICLLILSVYLPSIRAQQQGSVLPSVKFSGFVKTDFFYDSRQVSAANGIREGHFFLLPDPVVYDKDSNDVNANPSFHMLNIQTRLRADLSGPDAFGAKTVAAVEAEFFGTSEADLNGLRLRHAYVQMSWEKYVLLAGQTWHPMFPAESFPGTLSFNTGAPFTPFSRNPQLRLTRHFGPYDLILSAYTQRDFSSSGPDLGSSKYLRNSGIPGINIQARIPLGETFFLALGGDYKRLRPELKTAKNVANKECVEGFSAFLKGKVKTNDVTLAFMSVYAQNATDLVMIGGYGVEKITDTATQEKIYAPLSTLSAFIDLSTNGPVFKAGLFGGFSKNLGAGKDIQGPVYARGEKIDQLYRLSPRITFTSQMLTLGMEMEMTTAAYGTPLSDYQVTDTENVTHYRLLLCALYKF